MPPKDEAAKERLGARPEVAGASCAWVIGSGEKAASEDEDLERLSCSV
jgi:hypothetical protein